MAMTQLEKLQYEYNRAKDPAKKAAWKKKLNEYKKTNPSNPSTNSSTGTGAQAPGGSPPLSDKPQTGAESSPKLKAEDEAAATAAADRWYAEGSLGRLGPEGTLNPADPSAATTIAQREAEYQKALETNPYIEQALQRHVAGLEGISAPENQALRESGQRSIKQQAQTAMRALRGFNLKNNVTGGYGGYAIQRDLARNLAGQETDLIAANVAEKGRRLSAFGDYANQAYNTYNTARSSALDRLASDRLAQQNLRINADTYNLNRERDRALFNLQQAEKEKSGNLGVYYGNIGLDISRRAQDFENTLAEKEYNIAKKGLGA